MIEKWRSIPSFPDYEISDDGRVRKDGKLITIGKSYDGYPRTNFREGNKIYTRTIHPLVLEAFHSPRPAGYDCCHNDGIKTNNHISNLRWDTRKNNCADAVKHGTTNAGVKQWYHKLTAKDVVDIRKRYAAGETNAALAEEYKVWKSNISKITLRQSWKHIKEPSGSASE